MRELATVAIAVLVGCILFGVVAAASVWFGKDDE